MDIQTFETIEDARREIATMRGWDATPALHEYEDGIVWVIECWAGDDRPPLYLRTDGYVC